MKRRLTRRFFVLDCAPRVERMPANVPLLIFHLELDAVSRVIDLFFISAAPFRILSLTTRVPPRSLPLCITEARVQISTWCSVAGILPLPNFRRCASVIASAFFFFIFFLIVSSLRSGFCFWLCFAGRALRGRVLSLWQCIFGGLGNADLGRFFPEPCVRNLIPAVLGISRRKQWLKIPSSPFSFSAPFSTFPSCTFPPSDKSSENILFFVVLRRRYLPRSPDGRAHGYKWNDAIIFSGIFV